MNANSIRVSVLQKMPEMSPARKEGFAQGLESALSLFTDEALRDETLTRFRVVLAEMKDAERKTGLAAKEVSEALALVANVGELDKRARAALILTRELRDAFKEFAEDGLGRSRQLQDSSLSTAIKAVSYIVWAYLTGDTPESLPDADEAQQEAE